MQLNGHTEGDLVTRKNITHKKPPTPSSQGRALWAVFDSSLSPCAGQEVKQAAEPVVPRVTLPALFSPFPWRLLMLQLCIPSPDKSKGENPKPAGESAPSLASEAPGEKVLCSSLPTHSPDVPASLPHSFTLDNTNMLYLG